MPHFDTPQSLCRFGVARGEITPPVGIYHRMWGAASHDRSTGVHRPLTATAVLLQPLEAGTDNEGQIVLAVDHCLLWAKEMEELLKRVSEAADAPRESITVAFSHTHAAGLMDTSRAHLPGGDLIEPYLKTLAGQLAELVRQARKSLQPATLVYSQGHCNLAAQRDFWDAERSQYVCGFNPGGASDDAVLVARATDEHGRTLATLVNYACHPTTLAWQNTLISPDYPGAMREVIEQATSAPCIFLQGASGDIGPREGFVKDPQVADRNGRQLAHAALSALESLPPPQSHFEYTGPVVSGATLGIWEHVPLRGEALQQKRRWRLRRWNVDLPYREGLPTLEQINQERGQWIQQEQQARAARDEAGLRDARAMVERADRQLTRLGSLPPGPDFPLPVVAWQMGDALWLAVEGELYNHFQRTLRARFPSRPIVIITLANGSRPSYLPTRETYGKGIYQEKIAILAPGCLEQLTDAVAEQLSTWAG